MEILKLFSTSPQNKINPKRGIILAHFFGVNKKKRRKKKLTKINKGKPNARSDVQKKMFGLIGAVNEMNAINNNTKVLRGIKIYFIKLGAFNFYWL
jgi:hypothetical protein